jgi:translation initiation factor 1 (eIF-1/SUI1)
MAFNNSLLERTTFGNKSVQVYSCVADGATGTVVTGLQTVDFIQVTYKSMSSGASKFKTNLGTSGTAIAGTVAVTGVASGDEFYMTVYGR